MFESSSLLSRACQRRIDGPVSNPFKGGSNYAPGEFGSVFSSSKGSKRTRLSECAGTSNVAAVERPSALKYGQNLMHAACQSWFRGLELHVHENNNAVIETTKF